MKLENNGQDPSMADLFIATHKQKDGREYKSDSVATNYKLLSLAISGANSESVEQFIAGDSSHGQSWLVGRNVVPKKQKEVANTSETINVDEFAAKIEDKIQMKMEETVNKKVKEKMAYLVNKISQVHPEFTIDLDAIDLDDYEITSENDDIVSSKDVASN